MGIIGGRLGVAFLNRFAPSDTLEVGVWKQPTAAEVEFPFRLRHLFGERFVDDIRGKTVTDFGCGGGRDVVEMVLLGASEGVGLEIRTELFDDARKLAEHWGVADRCRFQTATTVAVDVVISVDAFEHFDNPDEILHWMAGCLKPDGVAWISFGPTWYHPRGGHLFSVFPWSHLIFTEWAQLEWRKRFRNDGATRFREVAGGLNQMSISRFKKIVRRSPFAIEAFETPPIRGIRLFDNPLTREFLSSCVRCRLRLLR